MSIRVMCVFLFVSITSAEKILAIIPSPVYSHQTSFYPIWRALSLKGHHVTLLTTNPMDDKALHNLNQINLQHSYELLPDFLKKVESLGPWNQQVRTLAINITNQVFENPEMHELIHNKSLQYDLVIVESLFPEFLALGEVFKCPKVLICSMETLSAIHYTLGNPIHPVAFPEYWLPYESELSFLERLESTLYILVTEIYRRSYHITKNQILKKHFGDGMLSLRELIDDMDMLFLNVNPMIHGARAIGPATVIYGGGIHIQPVKLLPKDLQDFLDNGKNGVIYFSLGGNIRIDNIEKQKLDMIFETLGDLPYKILFKFEHDDLITKPDNFKVIKWGPQQDILRHPNIRLFITQCGLQSMEEAILNHVPIVALPFMADQYRNARRVEIKGIGRSIKHQPTLSKAEFKKAILDVIEDPRYKNNIKTLAKLILDQPMSGTDKVVWWLEYVIRNKGAKHLRNPIVDLPFYQYYLLDLAAFFILILITAIIVMIMLFKLLMKKLTIQMKKLHRRTRTIRNKKELKTQ